MASQGLSELKTQTDSYGWDRDKPNRRTKQMLSQTSLMGKLDIQPEEIIIGYGTDLPPSRGASPTGLVSQKDKEVTDTEKAEWAHQDDPRTGRPARPFYSFGEGDDQAVAGVARENLHDYILSSPYGHPG